MMMLQCGKPLGLSFLRNSLLQIINSELIRLCLERLSEALSERQQLISKIHLMIEVNQPAPDFTLPDQDGNQHTLSDYRGQWVVLYFYPKDDTPGCTTEACTIRDNLPRFDTVSAKIFGISADSIQSHQKFINKFGLNFPLLADIDHAVCELYESWSPKKMFGKEFMGVLRNSYIIDPEGKIAKSYEKVNPDLHAQQLLTDLAELQKV